MLYQPEHIGSSKYFVYYKEHDLTYPQHIHHCFEIVYVNRGEIDVTIENTVYSLAEGEGLIVFPHQIHSFRSQFSYITLCIFSPDLIKDFSKQIQGHIPLCNSIPMNDDVSRLIKELEKNKSVLFRKGALYLLFDAFNSSTSYKEDKKDPKNILFQIISFVDKHMLEDCSLFALSEQLGYNYSYLSRYFKKAVGISFSAYVTTLRLNYACNLLKNENISILRCAMECGFDSLRNFNRRFKKQYGVSPSEYRATNVKEKQVYQKATSPVTLRQTSIYYQKTAHKSGLENIKGQSS